MPASTTEWNAVYEAAAQLIKSGAVSGVIGASYGGLFVDEYQDCIGHQHNVIKLLAQQLPSCIFGDPLQAIFDFHGQQPVDWNADVFSTFPKQPNSQRHGDGRMQETMNSPNGSRMCAMPWSKATPLIFQRDPYACHGLRCQPIHVFGRLAFINNTAKL